MRPEDQRAARLIAQAARCIVLSHVRPDGDAVGALLALSLSLEKAGKQVEAVLIDGLPGRFAFLPGADRVRRRPRLEDALWIAVDCADLPRLGVENQGHQPPVAINIDHHPTNTRFGELNFIDTQAASTTQILHRLIPAWGLALDQEVAINLLAGLLTDTIGFRTPNVTPQVLQVAADLQQRGAPLAELYERLLNTRSLAAMRYWGAGLSRVRREDGILWTWLTEEDRRASGYHGQDDADLINLLTTVEGALVTLVFIEQRGGKVKVSWRARQGIDVAALAQQFGGGGHAPAAGAMIAGPLDQVRDQVLSATRQVLSLSREPMG